MMVVSVRQNIPISDGKNQAFWNRFLIVGPESVSGIDSGIDSGIIIGFGIEIGSEIGVAFGFSIRIDVWIL